MGRSPCCDEKGLKKGPWTPEEDQKLVDYINKNDHRNWRALPKLAGLNRCGKSCRLRWTNYLRPDIKRGRFSEEDEQLIIHLHSVLGNKWSQIATHLTGRTDNEIKNYWNTHLKKKLLQMGIDPVTHRPRTDLNLFGNLSQLLAAANLSNLMNLQADADAQLARAQLLQNLAQVISISVPSNAMELINQLGTTPTVHDNYLLNQQYVIPSNNVPFEEVHPNGLIPPTFSNNLTHTFGGASSSSHNLNLDDSIASANMMSTIPGLVSSSPESSIVNQQESKKVNKNYMISTNSTTYEEQAWGDFNLDDNEINDNLWKHLME
ncbi:hypothetical protein ACHQM5_010315 [Ranunculus cassubicifolius]